MKDRPARADAVRAETVAQIPTLIQLAGRTVTPDQANTLAIREYSRGNGPGALDIYARLIAAMPDNAFAYNNRGVVLYALGRIEEALSSYARAVALKPDYAEAHSNRGVVLERLRRHAEALASCDRAIAIAPGYADAHYNRGLILQTLERLPEALASYDRAVLLKPQYAEAFGNRGVVLHVLKRFDEALDSYDQAIALEPRRAESYYNRASVLQILKRFDDALVDCDRALAIKPDYADACIARGIILVHKGALAEAEKMFVRALELRPDYPDALFELTKLRKYHDPEHEDIQRLKRLMARPGLAAHDREYLLFTLGKMHDQCGRYDDAFDFYRQANELASAGVTYNPRSVSQNTDAIIDVFSHEFLDQPRPDSSESSAPIFVVGMPRSGTTLLASILSNHPAIGTAGELPTIIQFTSQLAELVGREAKYPQAARNLTDPMTQKLAARYLARLRRDLGPDIPFVVDKHPINFRHLGLITLLFPRATILHCVRDPLDTCLSNFFQRFPPDYNFSFALESIGHYFREYTRLIEHWRRALPKPIIDVRYEDMVADTERIARTILDRMGLSWDERCLTPHTNPYPIETASNWQVRQPIYGDSVARWKHYEKHLAPLRRILGSAASSSA